MKKGDYVLATKYDDGDSRDAFCVGFWLSHTSYKPHRHLVGDENGRLFRTQGYSSAKKITKEEGAYILSNADEMEQQGVGVWKILEQLKREKVTL